MGHSAGLVSPQEVPNWDFIYQFSTVKHPDFIVGDYVDLPDGRRYRFCKTGAAVGGLARAVINGNVIPGDSGAGYEGSLVTAASKGEHVVTITDTGSAANRPADYYQGGMFVAFIASNYVSIGIVKSTVGDGTSINLTLDASLPADCSASVGITAYPSIYNSVKNGSAQLANVETFVCVPACGNMSAANTYFFGQTRGPLWVTPHGVTLLIGVMCIFTRTEQLIPPMSQVLGQLILRRSGLVICFIPVRLVRMAMQ